MGDLSTKAVVVADAEMHGFSCHPMPQPAGSAVRWALSLRPGRSPWQSHAHFYGEEERRIDAERSSQPARPVHQGRHAIE